MDFEISPMYRIKTAIIQELGTSISPDVAIATSGNPESRHKNERSWQWQFILIEGPPFF